MEEKKTTEVVGADVLEQLKAEISRLRYQNGELTAQCVQMRDALIDRRFEFMFKIVENSLQFSPEFVEKITKEIESAFTEPQAEETKPEKEATEDGQEG